MAPPDRETRLVMQTNLNSVSRASTPVGSESDVAFRFGTIAGINELPTLSSKAN
jgi:hypothetical protein